MHPLTINLSKIPYPKLTKLAEVGNSLDGYTLKNAKLVAMDTAIGSFDSNAYSMLFLNNGNKKYLAHIATGLYSPRALEKGLSNVIDELSQTSEPVKGVILGGWDSTNKQSAELSIFIANILDRFGIDFSMICGKPKGASPENLIASRKQVNIWSNKFKELFSGLDVKNATKDDIQNALEEHYEMVELSDNIPIRITDKFNSNTQHLVKMGK